MHDVPRTLALLSLDVHGYGGLYGDATYLYVSIAASGRLNTGMPA